MPGKTCDVEPEKIARQKTFFLKAVEGRITEAHAHLVYRIMDDMHVYARELGIKDEELISCFGLDELWKSILDVAEKVESLRKKIK